MNISLKCLTTICLLAACILATSTAVFAGGPAGAGSDAWTAYLERNDRFTPHANFCNSSTEAFVAMTPEGYGFCIDKNRNASTMTWNSARQTCVMAGKRLPEIAELQHACNRNTPDGLGLVNISGVSWEFGSNYGHSALDTHSSLDGVGIVVFGATNCNSAVTSAIAVGNVASTANFRCVR